MKRRLYIALLTILIALPVMGVTPMAAQEDELSIEIDPERGISGTTVTITGSGAPPNEGVIVSFAPWEEDQECTTPRGGETITTVTADQDGEFSATHEAGRLSETQVGNTYFAYVPMGGEEEPMSNLACFEFGADQTHDFAIDIDPEGGEAGTTVTINGYGVEPHSEVIVSYSPWDAEQACRAPRGGTTIDSVNADEDGRFSVTHTTEQFADGHVGNTYFAYQPVEEAPQPRSNLECFAFEHTNVGRYFEPTGNWVTDRMLEFWNNNGDLPVFGYPVSEDTVEGGRTVQYFERQRFELHPENDRPFDVLLGHLGKQAADERGLIDHEAFQPVDGSDVNTDACQYFEATGHSICHGFLDYWQSYGIDLGEDGVSKRESIMLFGYPISEEFTDPETGMTVQYFERAKLEYHPDNEAPWDVIPERLGANLFNQ